MFCSSSQIPTKKDYGMEGVSFLLKNTMSADNFKVRWIPCMFCIAHKSTHPYSFHLPRRNLDVLIVCRSFSILIVSLDHISETRYFAYYPEMYATVVVLTNHPTSLS
jgi:hypothetical protein